MSLIDDGTYFLLARPAAAGTAGTRIAFYQRTRWKSPPSDQDDKRDWWHRFRKPPYSWTHLKPQNRLLIKRPSRRRVAAAQNAIMFAQRQFMKCTLLASDCACFSSFSQQKKKMKQTKEELHIFIVDCDESWILLRRRHDRFLTNGRSLGETDVVYSSRYDITLHSRISMNRNGLQLPIVRFCVSPSAGCRNRVELGNFLRRMQFGSLQIAGIWSTLISNREYRINENKSKREFCKFLNISNYFKHFIRHKSFIIHKYSDQHQQRITDQVTIFVSWRY